jgi:hypothetical protein
MHSQELYNPDTTERGERFVFSHLRDLEQHYTLINLLLREKDRNSYYEYLQPEKIKESAVWKTEHESSRQLIAVYEERQRDIAKQIKDYLAADFWEFRNIPRRPFFSYLTIYLCEVILLQSLPL